jgi:peptide/nickel transport system substrate-binding protein
MLLGKTYNRRSRRGGPIGRRALLRRGALSGAGLAALALAACGGDGEDEGSSQTAPGTAASGAGAAAQPKKGGTLVIAKFGEPDTLDPAASTGNVVYDIARLVCEALVIDNPERPAGAPTDIIGDLAESWQFAQDGKSVTFTLRQGVTFHDGEPFNAEAVKFNFDRCTDANNPYFDPKLKSTTSQMYTWVQGVEVVDLGHVTFHLKDAFFDWVPQLIRPGYYTLMVSPKAVRAGGKDAIAQRPVGTGPFIFKEWNRGDRIVLVKNPNYWRGEPLLDQIVIRAIPDPTARLGTVEAGEADIDDRLVADQLDQVKSNKKLRFILSDGGNQNFWLLSTRFGPTQDVRLRQAINLAVDTAKIATDFYKGTGEEMTQWFSPTNYAYEQGYNAYPVDAQKAKALVQQSGYDGTEVPLLMSPQQQFADGNEILQSQLAAVGIRIKLVPFDFAEYAQTIARGTSAQFPIAHTSWVEAGPYVLEQFFHSAFHAPGGPNRTYYTNPETDQMLVAARTDPDRASRAKKYQEAQRRILNDAPHLLTYYARAAAAISNRVQGLASTTSWTAQWWHKVWLDA